MTAAPKPKPRKMWGVCKQGYKPPLWTACGTQEDAKEFANVLQRKWPQYTYVVMPIEEDADGR